MRSRARSSLVSTGACLDKRERRSRSWRATSPKSCAQRQGMLNMIPITATAPLVCRNLTRSVHDCQADQLCSGQACVGSLRQDSMPKVPIHLLPNWLPPPGGPGHEGLQFGMGKDESVTMWVGDRNGRRECRWVSCVVVLPVCFASAAGRLGWCFPGESPSPLRAARPVRTGRVASRIDLPRRRSGHAAVSRAQIAPNRSQDQVNSVVTEAPVLKSPVNQARNPNLSARERDVCLSAFET
jgi:hypothetical protein